MAVLGLDPLPAFIKLRILENVKSKLGKWVSLSKRSHLYYICVFKY